MAWKLWTRLSRSISAQVGRVPASVAEGGAKTIGDWRPGFDPMNSSTGRLPGVPSFAPHIIEAGEFFKEGYFQLAGGPIALLAYYQIRYASVLIGRFINFFSSYKHNPLALLLPAPPLS